MQVQFKGKEPELAIAKGYGPGDVFRNTKGNLMLITDVCERYVNFIVVSQTRKKIDKMYAYGRHHVDHMVNKGSYVLVGKGKIPTVEIEFLD